MMMTMTVTSPITIGLFPNKKIDATAIIAPRVFAWNCSSTCFHERYIEGWIVNVAAIAAKTAGSKPIQFVMYKASATAKPVFITLGPKVIN